MNAQQTANDIIDYLRQHILPRAAQLPAELTPEAVWELRGQLHALHYYWRESAKLRHENRQIPFHASQSDLNRYGS
ncbi:MAG: hypothetical protein O7E52_08960 [Candidatus Poribacteria bacterium]|nr:hypothetical protein [Candidatus Poribacteria bacterium]